MFIATIASVVTKVCLAHSIDRHVVIVKLAIQRMHLSF